MNVYMNIYILVLNLSLLQNEREMRRDEEKRNAM